MDGVKIGGNLKYLIKKNDENITGIILSCPFIYQSIKEGKETKILISCESVDEIEKRYKGLNYDQLMILFLENLHNSYSMMDESIEKELRTHNLCSMVSNCKMVAIGMIICYKYFKK